MNLLDLLVKVSVDDQASSQVDDISQGLVSRLGSAAVTAGKAIAGMWATKQVADFTKEVVFAYGSFEQMAGGVSKLFGVAGQSLEQYVDSMAYSGLSIDELTDKYERLTAAESAVFENASNAWRTAQMSQTDYLETATAFSGRLIRELGDSGAAAEQVDLAVRTLADSYNTYGTDMELQMQALSSIARGSYRMLDTLTNNVYSEGKESFEQFMQDARDYASQVSNMTFDEYAASMSKTGMSVDELSARYDKLCNSVDLSNESFADIITALSITNERTGVLGTTTKEALMTIEGSVNAAKAAWDNLVLELGKPDADISSRVSDLMTALFGEVTEGGERVGGVVRNIGAELVVIADNAMKGLGEVASIAMDAISSGVASGVDWLLSNGSTLVLNAVRGLVNSMTSAAKSLNVNLFDSDMLNRMFEGLEGSDVAERVSRLVGDIAEILREWSPDIVEAAQGLWDSVVQLVQTNVPVILNMVGDVLGNVGQAILDNWPTISNNINEMALSLLAWLSSYAPELVTAVADIMVMVGNWLVANAPAMLDAAVTMFTGLWQAIVDHAPTILSNVSYAVGLAIGYVAGAAASMFAAALTWVGGLLDGSTQQGEAVRQFFAGLPGTIVSALGDLGSLLWSAGVDLVQGFINGVKSMAGSLVDAAKGVVGDAVAGAKALLGISSPSKVFYGIGVNTIAGYVNALNDNARMVQDTMSKVMDFDVNQSFGFDWQGLGWKQAYGFPQGEVKYETNYYLDGVNYLPDSRIAQGIQILVDEIEFERRA